MVRIAIIGDYNPEYRSHIATGAALGHSAGVLGVQLGAKWVPTPLLVADGAAAGLRGYHGLLIAPGSPYRSMAGAFAAIRFARMEGWPLFGT